MRYRSLALLCATALAAASACSGDDDRPPGSLEGTAGSSSSGGKASPGGSSSQSDAGAEPTTQAGDGGRGGGGEGGGGGGGSPGIDYETAGAPPQIPGLCDPAMMLGKNQARDVDPLPPKAALLAMTPDELSVAFTAGDAPDEALYVADRESQDDAFAARQVSLPVGYEASSGVTLSSDGLSLVLVLADHSGFGALTRDERAQPFSSDADVSAFSRINAQKAMSGRELGFPVLSHDGGSLYYLKYFGEGGVVQSKRGADGRFDLGQELDTVTFGGGVGAYKRINALSSDERAIFFLDEATQHAMALFRSRPDGPFFDLLDLGARLGVAPNADCSRLYSSVDGQLVAQELK